MFPWFFSSALHAFFPHKLSLSGILAPSQAPLSLSLRTVTRLFLCALSMTRFGRLADARGLGTDPAPRWAEHDLRPSAAQLWVGDRGCYRQAPSASLTHVTGKCPALQVQAVPRTSCVRPALSNMRVCIPPKHTTTPPPRHHTHDHARSHTQPHMRRHTQPLTDSRAHTHNHTLTTTHTTSHTTLVIHTSVQSFSFKPSSLHCLPSSSDHFLCERT